MKEIPAEIRVFYDAQLVKERVPETSRFHYRKWLRYYLEFCSKYGSNQLNNDNISQFIDKLKEKHQTEQQQKQAFHAISAYFDIALPGNDKAAPFKNKKEGLSSEKCRWQSRNADWRPAFDALKSEITLRHYSPRTLQTYRGWVRQFQGFTRSKDPGLLTGSDARDFLTFLAAERKVAASTQNQAFNALLFFYRHILKNEFGQLNDVPRAKRRPCIPVVLSRE